MRVRLPGSFCSARKFKPSARCSISARHSTSAARVAVSAAAVAVRRRFKVSDIHKIYCEK